MKNLLNPSDNAEILKRISSITSKDKGLWGVMNVNEMLVHLSDAIKMAFGTVKPKFVGNFFSTTIIKFFVLSGMPAPKGKTPTVPELKQGVGGSKTTGVEKDKNALIEIVTNFDKNYGKDGKKQHPFFGNMNKKQWGRLGYIHINHHLQQFGK